MVGESLGSPALFFTYSAVRAALGGVRGAKPPRARTFGLHRAHPPENMFYNISKNLVISKITPNFAIP